MYMKPTIGADPEFFIIKRSMDSKVKEVISADQVLPSKENKTHIWTGAYFFDGVQAEINPEASICREVFSEHIQALLRAIYWKARDKYGARGTSFYPVASIKVNLKEMKKKKLDRECFRFGCSPDYNVYTTERIKYPNGRKFDIRFSGGHIHLGFDDLGYSKYFKDIDHMMELVYLLDIIPGVMSVAISPYEDEKIRRQWYGKAGSYRIQKHGIEYRTLSSFWLVAPPLMSLFTGLARDAANLAYHGKYKDILDIMKKHNYTQEDVRDIINNMDVEKAKDFYYTVLKEIWQTFNVEHSPFTPITEPVIDDFINNGYRKHFNPMKMLHYWSVKYPYLYRSNSIYYFGIHRYSLGLESYRRRIDKLGLI